MDNGSRLIALPGTEPTIRGYSGGGLIRAGAENVSRGGKLHPAQKPLALLQWCVAKTTGTVLDPYMGSGTTGVACLALGRRFIGIEIDQEHFATACQRLTQAAAQGYLFPSA